MLFTIPTILLLFAVTDTLEWKDVLIVGAVLGNIAQFVLTWSKGRSEIHSTDSANFRLDMDQFLELLRQIKLAHKEALEDDETISRLNVEIERLKRYVADCVSGHKDWADCKTEVIAFLSETENILQTANPNLQTRIAYLRGKLEAIVFLEQD